MSEEPKHTYTAREIVLELFPATHERLIPRPSAYRLARGADGALIIRDTADSTLLQLVPVVSTGNDTTQLCCDFCTWSGSRRDLELLRAEIPGSNGRRFRYVTACRDTEACEARRLEDDGIRSLLRAAS